MKRVELQVNGKTYWYNTEEYKAYIEFMKRKEQELIPSWLLEFLENPVSKDRSHDLVITNIYEKKKETI